MVGVVNPTANRTLDDYKAAAQDFNSTGLAPVSVAGGTVEAASDGSVGSNGSGDDGDDSAAGTVAVSMVAVVVAGLLAAVAGL